MLGPRPPATGGHRAVGLTQVAEAAVEPRVAEAGPVEAVAVAPVGTVTLLSAVLAVEASGAAWGMGSLLTAHPDVAPPEEMLPRGPRTSTGVRRDLGPQQPEDPAPQTGRVPGGGEGITRAGQPHGCGHLPWLARAPRVCGLDGGQSGMPSPSPAHTWETLKASPPSSSDRHLQRPDVCPSVVT